MDYAIPAITSNGLRHLTAGNAITRAISNGKKQRKAKHHSNALPASTHGLRKAKLHRREEIRTGVILRNQCPILMNDLIRYLKSKRRK